MEAPRSDGEKPHSLVDSSFPVLLPYRAELYMTDTEFTAYLNALPPRHTPHSYDPPDSDKDETPRKTQFMDGLARFNAREAEASRLAADNKMLTDNRDGAHRSTKSALVDAFYELEGSVSGARMQEVLEASWREDALDTLKVLFTARSIHLGKGSRPVSYKAFGWLYQNHPKTFLTNLVWLVQPVIEKKVEEKKEKEVAPGTQAESRKGDADDFVMLDQSDDGPLKTSLVSGSDDPAAFKVRNGVAHGYWKDLLNMLALAAMNEFRADGNPHLLTNPLTPDKKMYKRDWSDSGPRKRQRLNAAWTGVTTKFSDDPYYQALHFTVARLVATQLRQDSARLASGSKKELALISLAAKWAPSPKETHDQRTFVVSSIAEILHEHDAVCPDVPKTDRTQYLKHAREAYRRLTLSPLRKHLDVVERHLTAGTFDQIKYDRLPSHALRQHQDKFLEKDETRYLDYLTAVAEGTKQVSGATLLPSTLVREVYERWSPRGGRGKRPKSKLDALKADARKKLVDGQWKSLVQRIRASGALESAVAVADVSGSMEHPEFPDGTSPMDSSVGLALLIAEVCAPPFGGGFITFSESPKFQKVGGPDDTRTLKTKVLDVMRSDWGMNTNLVAVFRDLILPMAKANKLTQEDMVKRVFIFSDMQFDQATQRVGGWSTTYGRIKQEYADAGYEMPQVVFWNLAGARSNPTNPKPVTAEQEGTALVSGYSQAMLKVFLDGGKFEDEEEEEKIEEAEEADGDDSETLVNLTVKEAKKTMNPLSVVRKAISHPAYKMLLVVD